MGVENIVSFLKNNNTLKYLDISFNSLEDKALEILSEALKRNTCLRFLNLLGNEFGEYGLISLTNVLQHKHGSDNNTGLMILKIGEIYCEEYAFERFIIEGVMT